VPPSTFAAVILAASILAAAKAADEELAYVRFCSMHYLPQWRLPMKQVITALMIFAAALVILADEKSKPKSAREPELRDELLRRTEADQEMRKSLMRWVNEQRATGAADVADLSEEKKAEFEKLAKMGQAVDSKNTVWLQGIVEKHGWPTISLVGKEGADAAWLLVQHADKDRKFQRQCLDLMAALPKDEVSQSKIAYLTDRVLLAEGKNQMYGTQLKDADGKPTPLPIEDEANVDQRRSEVGLPPLAEYLKKAEQNVLGRPVTK
jgi:hypothetical protein